MGNYSHPLDGVLYSSCPLGMCGILYLLLLLLAILRSNRGPLCSCAG